MTVGAVKESFAVVARPRRPAGGAQRSADVEVSVKVMWIGSRSPRHDPRARQGAYVQLFLDLDSSHAVPRRCTSTRSVVLRADGGAFTHYFCAVAGVVAPSVRSLQPGPSTRLPGWDARRQ